MKVATILTTAIAATLPSAALAVSLPRGTGDGLSQPAELAQLLEEAKANVISHVEEQAEVLRKRGVAPSCTLQNLVSRRE
jgi:tyrosinase